jgi:hypothetical protein
MAVSARDLVYAGLRHEGTERIPYDLMFCPPAEAAIRQYLGAGDLQDCLDINLYFFGCADKPLYASPEQYGPSLTDQYGVVWSTSNLDRDYPIHHSLTKPWPPISSLIRGRPGAGPRYQR